MAKSWRAIGSSGWTRRELLLGAAALAATPAASRVARAAPARRAAAGQGAGALQSPARLDWFRDARFGLFVHWGPYSVAGVEASWPIMVPELVRLIGPDQEISEREYVALAERFDPREFEPRAWIRFARNAGMRYLVVTAKHHDGYCLFDAPGTRYKCTTGPAGRDLLAELAAACADERFPLGFYYSPPDMQHPGYRDTSRPVRENWTGEPERPQWASYLDAMEAQLRKLLTDYGDVAVLWFDGLFEHERYDPPRFHALVRELQPAALVNDRLGAAYADFVTPEQSVPSGVPVRRQAPLPDVTAQQFEGFLRLLTAGAPERLALLFEQAQRARFPTEALPEPERFQPWESCMTLGLTWAHDPLERALKSAPTVARTLVEVASRGGNLLLNVGPRADGTLPESAAERLRPVGRWLAEHGEALYGTTYGPVQGQGTLRTTAALDGSAVYRLELPPDGVDAFPVRGREPGSEADPV